MFRSLISQLCLFLQPVGTKFSAQIGGSSSASRLPRWLSGMNLPAMQEMQVRSLHLEDPLEEGMATHSSILAWKMPWTENPGGLQSKELQRVGHSDEQSTWISRSGPPSLVCAYSLSFSSAPSLLPFLYYLLINLHRSGAMPQFWITKLNKSLPCPWVLHVLEQGLWLHCDCSSGW